MDDYVNRLEQQQHSKNNGGNGTTEYTRTPLLYLIGGFIILGVRENKGPLLLTWINFNPSKGKYSHAR